MTVSEALAAHATAQIANAQQADAAHRSAEAAGVAVEDGPQPFHLTWDFAATVIGVRRS